MPGKLTHDVPRKTGKCQQSVRSHRRLAGPTHPAVGLGQPDKVPIKGAEIVADDVAFVDVYC